MGMYALTLAPTCIAAIWFRKGAALWLIALFPISFIGLVYQVAADGNRQWSLGAIDLSGPRSAEHWRCF